MKKIIYSIIAAALLLVSCNLDPEVNLSLTENQVMTYDNTKGRLNALYTYLPSGFSYIDNSMMAAASDEAEFTIETSTIQKFNTGAWNAVDNPDAASWTRNFNGIYAVNLFLATSDSIDMDYVKLNPARQDVYLTYLANIKRWKYEARFLRAFFYFELIKRYGGVPVLTEPVGIEDDYASIPRDSLSKCVRFILSECDSTAKNLPAKYTDDGDLGRVTKGAALALKSRVLLYAASDLFNDPSWAGGYSHPEFISLTDDKTRQERWEEAAQAAWDVIDLGNTDDSFGGYSLHETYNGLFNSFTSDEIILARRSGPGNSFEKNNYPIGYEGGNSGTTPTQNLVDAYGFTTSLDAFDWNNPEHAVHPYANRDPRLAYSILTNNTSFKGRPVQIWTGGLDGKGVSRATRTGYYIKKYINPNLDLVLNQTSIHTWILIRFAEMYLNYAEACYYAYGFSGRVPGATQTSRQALNRVRSRAGVLALPTSGMSDEEILGKIRNERRVELAFEDHRFWDVRRWMIAPATLGVPVKGVEITKVPAANEEEEDTFTYSVIQVEKRVFDSQKMYFYPIPQKNINITGWIQNPGW